MIIGIRFADMHHCSTTEDIHDYLATWYLQGASSEAIDELLDLYPDDQTQGSPFDTGSENEISPQFKRFAAIQGDLIFNAPRRFFLQQQSGKQNTWSYCEYTIGHRNGRIADM